jgi:hypothetical protein
MASRSRNGDRWAKVARSLQAVSCADARHELVDVDAAGCLFLGVGTSSRANVQALHLAAVLGLLEREPSLSLGGWGRVPGLLGRVQLSAISGSAQARVSPVRGGAEGIQPCRGRASGAGLEGSVEAGEASC